MKLEKAHIKNFRSIKEVEINFEYNCRGLVGINESGKTNILKALNLLDSEEKIQKTNNKRIPLPKEDTIEESYIIFHLELSDNDIKKIVKNIESKVYSQYESYTILKKEEDSLNLEEIIDMISNKVLYKVDIEEKSRDLNFTGSSTKKEEMSIVEGWKKVSKNCPSTHKIEDLEEKVELKNYYLLDARKFEEEPQKYLKPLKLDDFLSFIEDNIKDYVRHNLPNVIFWEYKEENILPPELKVRKFLRDPNNCKPLKNIFELAGHSEEEIKEDFNEAKNNGRNALRSFLDRIAAQTTEKFKEVWREYDEIEFTLTADGDKIIPGVHEQNTYDFKQRSDGFKRFVSFLLLISVKVETDKLQDTLILIDEPDISLHPEGTRFLRDELIRIAEKNYVVFSTHSIFMIDREQTSRHLIVEKENEKTNIEEVNESNIKDEEVIYNALGYSIFDPLQKNNLLFEGYWDKQLFKTAINEVPSDYSRIEEKLEDNVGICHAEGVKSIKNITPLLDLANKSCFIVTDSDTPAKEKQKKFQEANLHGKWRLYEEIDSEKAAVTSEDYVKSEVILKSLEGVLDEEININPTDLPDNDRLSYLESQLKSDLSLTNQKWKEVSRKIKRGVFEDLTQEDIEDSYFEFLDKLSEEVMW
ncbi:MAG: AAA family ATPase [Candidatus Magasanikbacteria bacterium]